MIRPYKLGELFCGAGGLALGASLARAKRGRDDYRVKISWATDYDPFACRTFRKNLSSEEPHRVICEDVRRLNVSSLPEIDALAFGFPCNDFSVVGEKKGLNGSFGPLYRYAIRVLNHFEPLWFLAENVGGLRSADNGRTLETILRDLASAGSGYTLTTHLYKFEEYGVPQTRHRIMIVGIRNDSGIRFKVPAPTHVSDQRTARDALENPPIPPSAANHELTKQSPVVVKRLLSIGPGENAWNAQLPPRLRLNVKRAHLSHIYKRLDPDRPAYTVTGSGGGGTHVYHWSEPRALTNRERARLQTFPDDYVFVGPKESVRRQIGMAVPPMAAKLIVEAILKSLAGIRYRCFDSDRFHFPAPERLTLTFEPVSSKVVWS